MNCRVELDQTESYCFATRSQPSCSNLVKESTQPNARKKRSNAQPACTNATAWRASNAQSRKSEPKLWCRWRWAFSEDECSDDADQKIADDRHCHLGQRKRFGKTVPVGVRNV